jgi:hypothetical protein
VDNAAVSSLSFPTAGKANLLNRINDSVVRSLLGNMHSVESDCPTREHVQWTGDPRGSEQC